MNRAKVFVMELNLGYLIKRYWLPISILGVLVAIIGLILIFRDRDGDPKGDQVNPPLVDTSTDPIEGGFVSEEGDSQLLINLSEGQAGLQDIVPVPTATGDPLSEDEINQILDRLPFLVIDPEDQQEFRLPEDPLPPPRTGETIDEVFPRIEDIEPEPVPTGPLEVLRFSPEGEIPLAPFVNITFNQPMVPIATVSQLSALEVPVQLLPDVPGTWRWVGTKTLSFEHDSDQIDRLPKATEYQVIIPAGVTSATGGILAETVRWTFSTPPPKMTTYSPSYGPQPLEPLFFIAFDQRIDPDSVMETIQVTADGKEVLIQLATEEEIEADKNSLRLSENNIEGRWLIFRAKNMLPADAQIDVVIGPGTPSAEGPLVTKESQSFNFRTYAPLKIEDHGCSWSRDECPPLTPFFIRFNNPLDIDAYDESWLTIDPPISGVSMNIYGNTINIQGATEGSTTYRITVDREIVDIFGQVLGRDETLTFRVGQAEPYLTGPDKFLVTLDPSNSQHLFSVYSLNYNKLDVRVYEVQPKDWTQFKEYVLDETMNVEAPSDVLVQVDIDLSRVMDGDYGHFIVIVEPTRGLLDLDPNRYWPIIQTWVQVTEIGLVELMAPFVLTYLLLEFHIWLE
jgi:hypothetical protein